MKKANNSKKNKELSLEFARFVKQNATELDGDNWITTQAFSTMMTLSEFYDYWLNVHRDVVNPDIPQYKMDKK